MGETRARRLRRSAHRAAQAIAICAIVISLCAFAPDKAVRHKDCAFQASSPKLFGLVFAISLFFCSKVR